MGTEKVNREKERHIFFESERRTADDEEEDGGTGERERATVRSGK